MADEPVPGAEKWPTTPDTPLEHAPGEKSKRWHRRMERLQRMQEISGVEHVRVVPRDERARRLIRHPFGGGFPTTRGTAEWPNDQFTQRRIADGTISIEPGSKPVKRLREGGRPTVGTAPPQARAGRSPAPPRPPMEPKT